MINELVTVYFTITPFGMALLLTLMVVGSIAIPPVIYYLITSLYYLLKNK